MSGGAKLTSCFFVTPIGAAGSDPRKRADAVLNHVLRPISKDFLSIVRADEVDEPGTITTDIVQRLFKSQLVIADLTGQNPNVMYEIGLRHCFNLPIVHIAQSGERPPFDLAAERIIFFDVSDLADVENAKFRILRACRSALDAKPFRSPVVRALELESLFSVTSELPMPRDLIAKLDDLEEKLDDVSSDLGSVYYQVHALEREPAMKDFDSQFGQIYLDRIDELVRLFGQVSPSDIQRIAEALRGK